MPETLPISYTSAVYLEQLARALEADRQPVCFTVGPDFEAIIIAQLSAEASPAFVKILLERGIEAIVIEGIPVRRMPAPGVALHTREISIGLDHTPSTISTPQP